MTNPADRTLKLPLRSLGGVTIQGNGATIHAEQGSYAVFERAVVGNGCDAAVLLDSTRDWRIENVRFKANDDPVDAHRLRAVAISAARGLEVRNCYFQGGRFDVALELVACRDCRVVQVSFDGSTEHDVLLTVPGHDGGATEVQDWPEGQGTGDYFEPIGDCLTHDRAGSDGSSVYHTRHGGIPGATSIRIHSSDHVRVERASIEGARPDYYVHVSGNVNSTTFRENRLEVLAHGVEWGENPDSAYYRVDTDGLLRLEGDQILINEWCDSHLCQAAGDKLRRIGRYLDTSGAAESLTVVVERTSLPWRTDDEARSDVTVHKGAGLRFSALASQTYAFLDCDPRFVGSVQVNGSGQQVYGTVRNPALWDGPVPARLTSDDAMGRLLPSGPGELPLQERQIWMDDVTDGAARGDRLMVGSGGEAKKVSGVFVHRQGESSP